MALARALQGNTTLTTLRLQDNTIVPDGTAALAEALRGNTTVTTLSVSGNRVFSVIPRRNKRYREQDQATAPTFSSVVSWVGRIHSATPSRIYEPRLWDLVAQYAFTTPKGRKDALRAARSHTQ